MLGGAGRPQAAGTAIRAWVIAMTTLIHVTHEAREKMGGIGAVLEGLLTARAYQEAADRTILIGNAELALHAETSDLKTIFYQTGGPATDGAGLAPDLARSLARIEAAYGVRMLYGVRDIACPLHTRRTRVELVLLDVRDALGEPVNRLKQELWEAYGLESDRFQSDWSYEEWMRLAGPALEAAEALLGAKTADALLISHEFMGLPAILAARLRMPELRTVYWAHEVPPVRDLIEKRADERLVFHEAMRTASGRQSYETLLRESGGFKQALVSRAHRAHHIFAVSDCVAQELALLAPEFHQTPTDVVYNGLPVRPIDLDDRLRSRSRLKNYLQALLGFRPDYVFTHVARAVPSKSLERDLAVLEHLDDRLADAGRSAALVVLATDGGRRSADLVRRMEKEYGWPVHHRVGWPDLVKGEVPFGQAAEAYNLWARATRAVLVNQFGLDRASCGDRVPEDLSFQDLRQGSDVEFGQSAYEPFGIAQLETLAFGGISVISRACGCAQFLARVVGDRMPENVLLAHYAAPAGEDAQTVDAKRVEHEVAANLARELAERLPVGREAFQRLLASGWELAQKMSWQAVSRDYVVPALARCLGAHVRGPERKPPARSRDRRPAREPAS
jgi:glycosyltransferase involved in cell wall biosynthesis